MLTGVPETNKPGRKHLQLGLGLTISLNMIVTGVQGEIATLGTQLFDQKKKSQNFREIEHEIGEYFLLWKKLEQIRSDE